MYPPKIDQKNQCATHAGSLPSQEPPSSVCRNQDSRSQSPCCCFCSPAGRAIGPRSHPPSRVFPLSLPSCASESPMRWKRSTRPWCESRSSWSAVPTAACARCCGSGSGAIITSEGHVLTNHPRRRKGDPDHLPAPPIARNSTPNSSAPTYSATWPFLKLDLSSRKDPSPLPGRAARRQCHRHRGRHGPRHGKPRRTLAVGYPGHRLQHRDDPAQVLPFRPGRRERGRTRPLDRTRRCHLPWKQRRPPGQSRRRDHRM